MQKKTDLANQTVLFLRCKQIKINIKQRNCIIASGGLPLPSIGGGDLGIRTAKKLGIETYKTEEALVPIVDNEYSKLSGISVPVEIKVNRNITIKDDLLFTHKGLSGPAILKATLYFDKHSTFNINFIPGIDLNKLLEINRGKLIKNCLSSYFPERLNEHFLRKADVRNLPPIELSKKELNRLTENLTRKTINYEVNEGYRKAEVMKGGIKTSELKKNCESRKYAGLYFIGETVDVTGARWL